MFDSIGTLIGLLVAAALGVLFDRLFKKWEKWNYLKTLSHVIPLSEQNQTAEIFVRPSLEILAGGRGGASKRAYTHVGDVLALQHLGAVLHQTPVTLRFRYDENSGDPTADWIILGLSRQKSRISDNTFQTIREKSGLEVVKGDGSHQYFKTKDGREFRCEHVADSEFGTKVKKDYGLIARLIGDAGNHVLICGGIHMFGTQAALEVAISGAFVERVRESGASEFVQIVEVPILEDGITVDQSNVKWSSELPFIKMN